MEKQEEDDCYNDEDDEASAGNASCRENSQSEDSLDDDSKPVKKQRFVQHKKWESLDDSIYNL